MTDESVNKNWDIHADNLDALEAQKQQFEQIKQEIEEKITWSIQRLEEEKRVMQSILDNLDRNNPQTSVEDQPIVETKTEPTRSNSESFVPPADSPRVSWVPDINGTMHSTVEEANEANAGIREDSMSR